MIVACKPHAMKQRWNPASFQHFYKHEHDACGIVAAVEKRRIPTRENITTCINALVTMNHRAGFINGEGDGVGIHIDIPKALWKEKLAVAQLNPQLVDRDDFIVGHIFITRTTNVEEKKARMRQLFAQSQLTLIFESDRVTSSSALGPIALREEPVFWQVALLPNHQQKTLSQTLFELTMRSKKMNIFMSLR